MRGAKQSPLYHDEDTKQTRDCRQAHDWGLIPLRDSVITLQFPSYLEIRVAFD
jgi:hypothetical protein